MSPLNYDKAIVLVKTCVLGHFNCVSETFA